jgi:hypothetical protein
MAFRCPPNENVGDTRGERHQLEWYGGGWNRALADGVGPAAAHGDLCARGDSPCSSRIISRSTISPGSPGTNDRAEHLKDGD